MSLLSQLKGKVFGKASGTNFTQDALRKAGLQLISTQRIEERIEAKRIFDDTIKALPPDNTKDKPEELFEWHVDNWHKAYNMYKQNQVPWLRAGSDGTFGRMTTAIETMHEEIEVAVIDNRNILAEYTSLVTKAEKSQDTVLQTRINVARKRLVRDFHVIWLVKLGYKFLEMQSNLTWLTEDVSTPESFPIITTQPLELARVNLGPDGGTPGNQTKKTSKV